VADAATATLVRDTAKLELASRSLAQAQWRGDVKRFDILPRSDSHYTGAHLNVLYGWCARDLASYINGIKQPVTASLLSARRQSHSTSRLNPRHYQRRIYTRQFFILEF
jgi:hypothetical protein